MTSKLELMGHTMAHTKNYPRQLRSQGLLLLFALQLFGCSSNLNSGANRGGIDEASANPSDMLAGVSASVVAVGHQGTTIGSAFALAPNQFVTSNHIAGKASIYLLDAKGKPVAAKLMAQDGTRDIAILQAALEVPSLQPAATSMLGTTIYAVGNPFGMGITVTRGIVSAQPRSIGKPHLLQIDAAINPGNSGGPVVNSAGQVVGLVSSRAALGSGIAFAVPVQFLLTLLDEANSSETTPAR